MKTQWKRICSFVLCCAMVLSLFPQLAVPAAAAGDPNYSFGTTNTADDWSSRTGFPTSCSGKALLALFFNGDTFPGEPRTHDGASYIEYNTSFQKGKGSFKASEILQGVMESDSFVLGENSYWLGRYWTATSGIFDPNGVDDKYFTENFRAALDARELSMIADVIAAKKNAGQSVGSENPEDYDIVWYIIKYQTTDSTWHINGLIRERDKYSVIYDGNGATVGSPPDGVIDMSYSDATNYTVQGNKNGLGRGDAYDFVGWNTQKDGSGIFYNANQKADLTVVGENPITLYAQWKEKNKVTVTWIDGDNNTIHVDTDLVSGRVVDYDGATPTKAADTNYVYTFNGKWKDKNGNEVALPLTMGSSNVTLYAQFDQAPRTYTVTWVNHTVIGTTSGLANGASTSYTGEVPVRSTTETEGYLFSGWSTTENGAVEYGLRDPITVNGDMTLYAQFTLVPMRTVTWYSEDGSTVLATERALEGAQVSYPNAAPVKAGNTFAGWATVANGSAAYAAGAPITVNGNMNLYVDFEPTKHTITWKNWDNTVLETDNNVPYGAEPEYNGAVPVRPADTEKTYTFVGWTPAINTVTGDMTYTATYTSATRAYTVTWNNYDNTLIKRESVNYNVTPAYTGATPTRTETATHTFLFNGWTPTVSPVTGDVTYTATYHEVEKTFEATVKVWLNPTADTATGAIISGTPVDLSSVNASYSQLYLRNVADSSKIYPLEAKDTGVYKATATHGTYVVVSENTADSVPVIEERIVLPLDTVSSDPDSTTADIIFFSVTYDFAEGLADGVGSKTEFYQRGTDVFVSDYTPVRTNYIFNNWYLDSDGTTYLKGQRITVYDGGIIKPHTLTAQWIRANDNVVVNLTIHHHSDPALSGSIGMNPNPGSVPIQLDLTYRPEDTTEDYVEQGLKFSSSDWFTKGTTVTGTASYNGTSYNTKTTTISFAASATGFAGLTHPWDYSANVLLRDYFLTERTVTETEGTNGDVTYTVNAVLQYHPALFDLTTTVKVDDATIAAGLTPTAVDLKVLSYKNGAWSPISRLEHSSVEARFVNNAPVTGSYGVPIETQTGDTFHYRVSVVGFTLPDGTELTATGGDLVNFSSDPTGSTATYRYSAGAYTALVTVSGVDNNIGGVPAVYGDKATGNQVGTITVTVSANPYTVTFDPNGGTLNGSTGSLPVPNQFRIPILGGYVPTRAGGYVFDGWMLDGSLAKTGDPLTENVTLVAKWIEPLTVRGEVRISATDSNGNTIRDDCLPTSLTVTLERTTPSGDKIIVQAKTYSLTASSADYTDGVGVVAYEFAPVQQDGSKYRIYVNVTNYETAFLNEPGSNTITAADLADPAKYTGTRDAVDSETDGDSDAIVYAYLIFDPQEFDLTWKVDAGAISSDFRPDSVGIIVRYNSENDATVPFENWATIIQHYNGSVYSPVYTVLDSDGTGIGKDLVWTVHPDGYAFDYAVKVHQWVKNGSEYDLAADTPFTVTYAPAVAWFDGTKQVTADPTQDLLVVTLTPKTYTITYDLNAGGDAVTGFAGAPTTHTWSFATGGIPTALVRRGYDFLGWVSSAADTYADGKVLAETAEDITLTAVWRQQKEVTFRVVNGTWSNGSTDDIVAFASLDAAGNGSVSIPTGMLANYGYGNGSWNDAALSGATLAVSGNTPVTYTFTFERLYHNVGYDTDGVGGIDASDAVAHGNYIQVDPAGGEWNGSSDTKGIRMEAALDLTAATRTGYIFAGWHRHYTDDTTTYPGSTVSHRYVAQWLRDSNNDGVADIYQKRIVFRIENGTWDGTNAAQIEAFVTPNADGTADISAVIPTGMQPNIGFVAENAFWSPALPAGNIVAAGDDAVFTYRHYTTITYSDFAQSGATAQLLILPESLVSIDPAGGKWDENTVATIALIRRPYVLEDAVYTNHDFLGWKAEAASGELTYTFTAQWKKDTYTILWKNENGDLLETDNNVEFGTMPEYNGATPTKASSEEFDYTFKGWTPAVTPAADHTTYTAEYTATRRSYTVTWKNWDGTVLDTDTVEYGRVPSFAGIPTRPASDEFTYTFNGWNSTPVAVTGDATYTATYRETTNQYTVTWLDENGNTITSGLVNYGTMPTAPTAPAKPATAQYTYAFAGWSPAVVSVTGDAVYRATYSATVNKYTVTWYEEDGVSVIDTAEVEYGQVPTVPAAPAKTNTAQYSYTFSGWKAGTTTYIPASIPIVTGDVAYTAQYAETVNKYTVTWQDYNGAVLETDNLVAYGTSPSFASTSKLTKEDANHDFEFLGWYLSTDTTKTVVDLAAQTVTGNVTYVAKYLLTSKARTATVHVWINATAANGTGGTPGTIATVTNGLRSNLYFVPELSADDPSKFIPANWSTTALAYTATLMPGNYLIYAGNSAADAVREANQIVSIVNTNVSVHTLYNSVTYDAGEGSFDGGAKTIVEYYKSGFGPVYVGSEIPSRGGKVFTHWHDAADTPFNASTTAVPVKLTDRITKAYTLTAHWSDAANVTVIVNVDTKDANGQTDTDFANKNLSLQLAGKLSTSDASVPYAAIYGTNITGKYSSTDSAWSVSGDVYTFTTTYTDQRGDYVYEAIAQIPNYDLESITVSGNTVTINLKYDPAGFDLTFRVEVDPSVPDELVPRAVDVQIVFFNRDSGSWQMLSNTQNKALEVVLSKDAVTSIWSGEGTYHVWSKYTSGMHLNELYLYRIAVTDFDLGVNRGSLAASGNDFKVYSSVAGSYHPAGAYTASVTVVDQDPSCTSGAAGGLLGSHESNGGQHGTVTATISVNPYTVTQHYGNGTTPDKNTTTFLTPELDTPTFAGHSFAGWWTKDGSGGDWGTQITAAGLAVKNLVPAGSTTLDLYARWNPDWKVTGTVTVSNKYNSSSLYEAERPNTVQVELRNAVTNALISSVSVALTDDASDEFRSGTYLFENVPNNGASYRISVVAPNYEILYDNEETVGFGETNFAATDENGDHKAVVDVQMAFNPHNFDLEYTVDATNLGEIFRPSEAGVVVLSGDPALDPQTWAPITQQVVGGVVTPHTVAIDATTGKPVLSDHAGTPSIWHHEPVWRRSPFGELYEYAIQLRSVKIGTTTYDPAMASTPFTVIYAPTLAWFDSETEKQAAPATVLNSGITLTHPDGINEHGLVAYIVPKTYTITYELGRTGTVDGAVSIDGNTAQGSFRWSYGLAALPAAAPSGASGVSFGGWWTQDGTGGNWGTKVEKIDADTPNDLTLYARWNYTVTWDAANGSAPATESVLEGTMPTAPADPAKAATAQYTYTFTGWSPVISAVTGNVTYTAQYDATVNTYTITWNNYNGTLIKSEPLAYGTMPAYTGSLPTKDSTAQYLYTFSGWTPTLATVTGDATYTAMFTETERSYTVTWKNHDGTQLDLDTFVGYGVQPVYEGATPSKAGNAQYSYTFIGWKTTGDDTLYTAATIPTVVGDIEYTAQFEESTNSYTVTWLDWDGSPLETDSNVPYNTMPTYDGAEPSRDSTAELEYYYLGWDKAIEAVTGDVTYKAQYFSSTRKYTVTWLNYDGSPLETDSNVDYGTMPSYDGAEPSRSATAQFSYTFTGWTPALATVTGDVTYTATFTETVNCYTVTYQDGVSSSEVFADQSYTVEYGTPTPAFAGTPYRAGYTFNGWEPSVSDTVTEDAVYTAKWSAISIPVTPSTGSAKLIKVDADNTDSRLPNVVFALYRATGTLVGTFTTNANGEITVSSLAPGSYYWVETRPAEGYVLDDTPRSFTVTADQTAEMTVANKHSDIPSAFSGEHYAYIVGRADGLVHPEANITRAEVATIFFRLLDPQLREQYLTTENSFNDVEHGRWFNTAVSTLSAMGILNGRPDGGFHPNDTITRAEFAAIAARFDATAKRTGTTFTDIDGHWAQGEINAAANNGWILGYEDGTFRPNQSITRAEAMALVNRVLQRIPETAADLSEDMIRWADNANPNKWYYLTIQEATNSHDYRRKPNGHEYWTAIKESPDWAALER